MRSSEARDGVFRHSLKNILVAGIWWISVLASVPAAAASDEAATVLDNETRCIDERPLGWHDRMNMNKFIALMDGYESLHTIRTLVGTSFERRYTAKYREMLEKHREIISNPKILQYVVYLSNLEEMYVHATRILGSNNRVLKKIQGRINQEFKMVRWIPRDQALLMLISLKEQINNTLDKNSKLVDEEKEMLRRQALSAIAAVYEFWIDHYEKREAHDLDREQAGRVYLQGFVGATGAIVTTFTAGVMLHASLKAATVVGTAVSASARSSTFWGSTAFSCLNGAIGGISYTAAYKAYELYQQAADRASNRNTSVSCEMARILEKRTAEDREDYLWAAGTGFVLGCGAGVAGNYWPKATANALRASVGVAATYDAYATVVSEMNRREEWDAYTKAMMEFHAAEKDLAAGLEVKALSHLLKAQQHARERNLHVFEGFYKALVFASAHSEIKHIYKSARAGLERVNTKALERLSKKQRGALEGRRANRHYRDDFVAVVASASDVIPVATISILRFYEDAAEYLDPDKNIPRPGPQIKEISPDAILKAGINIFLNNPQVKRHLAQQPRE